MFDNSIKNPLDKKNIRSKTHSINNIRSKTHSIKHRTPTVIYNEPTYVPVISHRKCSCSVYIKGVFTKSCTIPKEKTPLFREKIVIFCHTLK